MKKRKFTPRISDQAIRNETSRSWGQWFAVLDFAGARKMSHQEIVASIGKHYPQITGWWQQMITATYEQVQGKRKKYERPGGYEINISKTMSIPQLDLYKACLDKKQRSSWLSGSLMRSTNTKNKSIRLTWKDRKSIIEIQLYKKGPKKTQVVIQHSKLLNQKAVQKLKIYWRKTLGKLENIFKKHARPKNTH